MNGERCGRKRSLASFNKVLSRYLLGTGGKRRRNELPGLRAEILLQELLNTTVFILCCNELAKYLLPEVPTENILF